MYIYIYSLPPTKYKEKVQKMKNKHFKRLISLILAVVMLASTLPALPITVNAAGQVKKVATFEFGVNGTATHSDGSSASSYSESNSGYTLTLSNLTNVYKNARDAKGNSCLKLGAGSKAGSFSFTVPDDVEKVILKVAQYKANTTKITVNSTSYTITTASSNGAYTDIEVDTSSTKTVSLTTVSGGYRAMLNTIEFYKAAPQCDHQYSEATCTTPQTCQKCGATDGNVDPNNHVNIIAVGTTQAPTCTEDGTQAGSKCTDCGKILQEEQTQDKLGHDDSDGDGYCNRVGCGLPVCDGNHNWGDWSVSKEATCTEGEEQTRKCVCGETESKISSDPLGHDIEILPAVSATCTSTGLTEGQRCKRCSDPEVIKEQTVEPMTDHTYVDGKCSCGAEEPKIPAYGIVTDISHLAVGDTIIIINADKTKAMGVQSGNNCPAVTVSYANGVLTYGAEVQILTLTDGTVDGTFAFNTGSGYLYAASSSSNYLKTQSTNNANGSWKIEINANGVATIKAQGTYTHNWMRYNSQSNLFSSYASGQNDISIYKVCPHKNTEAIGEAKEPTCTEPGLNAGKKCSDCGIVITAQEEIPANGHTEEDIPKVEATCQQEGSENGKKCSVCGKQTKAPESIPKTEHPNINGDNVCDFCGDPICNHVFDNGKITQVPTCKQKGEITYTCTQENCDYSYTEELEIDPDNHTEKDIPGKAATCTEDGLTNGKICSECGETTLEQETIDALGHTEVPFDAKDPTCSAPGHAAGIICSTCGKYVGGEPEIYPVLSHQIVNGICTYCKKFFAQSSSTIIFDENKTQRTEYSSTKQTWTNGEITFINNKASSTTNVGDYSNPIRLYKSSEIIFSAVGSISQITITSATGSDYIEKLEESLNNADLEYSKNNSNYTITVSNTNELTLVLAGQVRFTSITVTYLKEIPSPQLQNYNVSLNKGVTISVSYNVPTEWLAANQGATATFNGETVDLMEGVNSFKVTLTPKRINEELKLVIKNSEGETLTSYDVSFSVYKNMIDSYSASALGISDAKYSALKTLLEAIVTYGNAATDSLAEDLDTESFNNVDDWTGTTDVYDIFGEISAELREEAAIHLSVKSENLPADGTEYIITVKRGETILASGEITKYIVKDTVDGETVDKIIISGLFPADFNKEISITVTSGEEEVAQATFTFNEYLKAIYNSTEDTYLRNMIAATYQYGVAVDTYKTAQ